MGADPNYGEGQQGEEDIGDKLGCRHAGGLGHVVWDVGLDVGRECEETDVETLPADPCLETIPYCDCW